MSSINFQMTYRLGEDYDTIKQRAVWALDKYLDYPNLIAFHEEERSVTFTTERLIPDSSTNRPRVMLLFSNPHPHSVHQGMFLSPNTRGRENLFWPVMRDAGWLSIPEGKRNPEQIADICLEAQYPGPFELIFYCYYAFPTDDPEDIKKIFGKEFFNQVIAPQASQEFRWTLQKTSTQAVVAFNKNNAFNLVANDPIDVYIERIKRGEVIHSNIKGIDEHIPVFQTFPTGWRYHKKYRHYRKVHLERIKTAILSVN